MHIGFTWCTLSFGFSVFLCSGFDLIFILEHYSALLRACTLAYVKHCVCLTHACPLSCTLQSTTMDQAADTGGIRVAMVDERTTWNTNVRPASRATHIGPCLAPSVLLHSMVSVSPIATAWQVPLSATSMHQPDHRGLQPRTGACKF